MDDAVGLVIVAPVLAFGIWVLAFFGAHANGAGRAVVAAELAAAAAADAANSGASTASDAADHAERMAIGAALSACGDLDTRARVFVGDDGAASAVVDIECIVSSPMPENVRLCFTGFASDGIDETGHVRRECPIVEETP